MIPEFIKSAFEFLKLAPRYLIAVALVSGVLLFTPETWLQKIEVSVFASENRQWLGLIFIVSGILWGVYAVTTCWNWIYNKFLIRGLKKHIVKKLSSLTEDEKQILRYYVAKNTRANVLSIQDGVVKGLVANSIIYRSVSVGSLVDGFAHNITDHAWDYIHSNPQVLEGTTNTYRTDKRNNWYD